MNDRFQSWVGPRGRVATDTGVVRPTVDGSMKTNTGPVCPYQPRLTPSTTDVVSRGTRSEPRVHTTTTRVDQESRHLTPCVTVSELNVDPFDLGSPQTTG